MKQYQLICTYLKDKYFISTAFRQSSAIDSEWYFETIVWEWDNKTKTRGNIISIEDSSNLEDIAIQNHFTIIKKLNN